MQALRFEGSLMTSLAELKSIEQQRLADEKAAVIRADELRIQALVDAERQAREVTERKVRDAHEAQLAIERTKAEAERELRLRVEAAEQAERARQQIALEQERQAQEMELRRAEVAKKRPTWMVAVTGLALALAAVLVVFTVKAVAASGEAEAAKKKADLIAEQSEREVEEMRRELDKLDASLKTLDGNLEMALDRVAKAQTQAEAKAAAEEFNRIAIAKREAKRKADEIRAARDLKIRTDGARVDPDCVGVAVCKKVFK